MAEIQKNPQTAGEMTVRFTQFVMMQTQNILFLLGQMPTPDGRKMEPDFEMARMLIDQIEMIEEKTRGNLNKEESDILENALANTRMVFVKTIDHAGGQEAASQAQERPAAPEKEIISGAATVSPSQPADEDEDSGKRFSKKY